MARRFYLEGKSKIQIAEEFGVSRFKVARVLETALERDLVRIEIRVPAELDAERSDALRARYGLRHAVVVESPAGPASRRRRRRPGEPRRGRRRSARRAGHRGRCARAGLGPLHHHHGGRAATASRRAPSCSSPVSTTRAPPTAARSRRCAARPMSPAARRTRSTRRWCCPTRRPPPRCAARPASPRAMSYFDKVTVAVVSIGSWEPGVSTVHDMLTRRGARALRRAGVAAEMSSHLFDAEGRRIGRDLGERCITVEADRLRRIPEVRRHRRRPAQGRRDRRGAAFRAGDQPGHGHRRRRPSAAGDRPRAAPRPGPRGP